MEVTFFGMDVWTLGIGAVVLLAIFILLIRKDETH